MVLVFFQIAFEEQPKKIKILSDSRCWEKGETLVIFHIVFTNVCRRRILVYLVANFQFADKIRHVLRQTLYLYIRRAHGQPSW